ncbi:MAG: helix-turn-helix domain-containing protein [Candidatus Accumulibacter sp.]|jgi:transcriptional regulator with XRE-family HTH domain|nr:helix-turn-helix domain-containing protein [Accumulibacter sp.]
MRAVDDQALMKALAGEIKARRAGLKISQEELADRAGVNRTYIGKIELARNQPTVAVLFRISQALEVEPPEFVSSVQRRQAKELRLMKKNKREVACSEPA